MHYGQLPFSLPAGWAWSRLHDIYNFIDYRGVTPQKIESGIPLVTAKNVKHGFIDYSISEYISRDSYEERKGRGISQKGDILFTTEAPLGNVALADLDEYSAGQRLITFQNYSETVRMNNRLFMYFLLSDFFKEQLKEKQTGTTVFGIKAEKLKQLLLPVPPLIEQSRITCIVESAFAVTGEIERGKTDLHATVAAVKSKILSLAIRGKLVPQDPNDEPASVLLERIRAEREELVQAGKIKRDKGESIISRSDDSSYYENMPNGWISYSIEKLFSVVGGGTPSTTTPDYWGNGIPWFSSADIAENGKILPRRCVTQLGIDRSTTNVVPEGSVVVVTRVGLGKVAILDCNMCFSQDNHALIPNYPDSVYNRFIFHFLFHQMRILKDFGRGTTISGITKKQLTDIQILLPPITEQHRIVDVIESAYEQLDKISENIS